MAKYIFAERNGIYIVDLQKTLRLLGVAYEFVRQTVQNGGKVLFVGTKKQSQQAVEQEALPLPNVLCKPTLVGRYID